MIVILGTLVAGSLGHLIYQSISRPISRLSGTVHAVSDGDYSVRTRLEGQDELGELGNAFDNMLEDKVTALAIAETENEQLNNSIIELIRSVAEIGNKDFTIKIPVKEDVTGAIGDSLNLLTRETSAVLNHIHKISRDVAEVSNRVKQQSDRVISLAQTERTQVQAAARGLEESSQTMRNISQDAQAANEKAGGAMANTQIALESVSHTVQGINNIRDTIGEAEKRIKRLGERSQEITGIVNLINSIAERTHILALNASMHAASAGEAGRGFAVVANEVQRLAENAREATSEISTLVNNIRVETVDTVSTMNTVISQVSEGTRLAEQAGENMQQTKLSTSELVASVQQIAESSQDQADTSIVLRDRANEIEVSTRETAENLQQQTIYTDRLVKFSEMLVKSVEIFRLPPTGKQISEDEDMEEAIAVVDAEITGPLNSMQKAV
jgi:methyl-accepting chemotaxis protein